MKTLLQQHILAVLLVTGCGIELQQPTEETINQPTETVEEPEEVINYSEPQPIYLKGSVSSAFNITVDGQNYTDSEDFYTQQLDVLTSEKEANGYADYKLTFDAQLGLNDLKDGMTLQAEGIGDTGYAGETIIINDGTFELRFPSEAEDEILNIRATKRIGVILTSTKGENIYWCYNFYAKKEIELKANGKPIILRHFETKLTKYKCEGRKTSSLSIPKNASNVVIADKPSQPAQIESWDDQWQDEVIDIDDKAPTQEELDAWDKEWNEVVLGAEKTELTKDNNK